MAEEKETGFKITDRRKFNPDGTPRDIEDEPAAQPAAQAPEPVLKEVAGSAADNVVSFEAAKKERAEPQSEQTAEPGAAASEQKQATAAAERAYNQANAGRAAQAAEPPFMTLIDLLAAQAAMFLGIAEAPDGRQLPVDLNAARHFIDLLGALEQKTKGNLTPDEAEMLESVLAYLRMQFVALSRGR
ncbi:MAG TPA: DUF1844 domain-containing protein [Blastocatellia bacterium]|jgi:hypothetical protein|nr:DUF1844 domain-containing protein [Blastocatellia bacterium]